MKKSRNDNRYSMLYILKVLVEHSDAYHPLTQSEIVKYLESDEYEFPILRAAVSDNLKALSAFGTKFKIFDIKGLDSEKDSPYSEDDVKKSKKRGVWIKRSFSDKELQLLIDSVLYSKYINNEEAASLIRKINSLGSKTFRDDGHNISKLNTIPHTGYTEFIKELGVLQQAIAEELKVSFSYGNYHENGQTHVLEAERKIVSPYHLAFVNGYYYMIGWDEKIGIIDHYRIDKIKDAKKLDSKVKSRTNTELKGTIVSDYLSSHPFMSTAKPEKILFKIESKYLSHVVDTFGNSYDIKKDEINYKTIEVTCNKEDGFYWAMQNGGYVEILQPQELRDQIRDAVEGMAMRYLQRDGDRYTEAIRATDNNGDLDLTGIIVGNRTVHHSLRKLKSLRLSDNNLSDISFIKNYENLYVLSITNNPVVDISPLADREFVHTLTLENLPLKDLSPIKMMKSLKYLSLDLSECEDYSVLYELKNLKRLTIQPKGVIDVERIKTNNPEIRISEFDRRESAPQFICYEKEFPLNVIKEAFGYDRSLVGSLDDAIKTVNGILDKFADGEKETAICIFKEDLTDKEICEKLKISSTELMRRWKSIQEKLKNKYYNKTLEKFTTVTADKKYAAMEKLNHILNRI